METNTTIEDPSFKGKSEEYVDINRKVNLLYVLAGVYDQSLEIVEEALKESNLQLRGNDQKILKEILKLNSKIRIQIDKLQRHSVLKLSENEAILHESTIHMFFSLFMSIICRAGVDELADYRIYNIYNMINRYKPLVKFRGLDIKDTLAFSHIRERIANDPYIHVDSLGNLLINAKTKDGSIKKYQLMQIIK